MRCVNVGIYIASYDEKKNCHIINRNIYVSSIA